MFNLDPKKMQAVMKQMGIKQEEINALRVIIEKEDNSKIILESPSVVKLNMQGQSSYQISGEERKEEGKSFTEGDVETVMEKTKCSREEAENALEANGGNLADAILELSA